MQADIYSLGIILFELFCPFGTEMERVKNIKDLRQGRLPQDFCEQWPEEVRCGEPETHNTGRQSHVGWPSDNKVLYENFKGAQSRFAHIEKFSLNFSNSSFVIRVNLLHP